MAGSSAPIIGIDLGTTYSVVAVLDAEGRPRTLPNRDGDLSTPSVVLFDEDGLVVGKEALRLAQIKPDRVAAWPKRDMGSEYYRRPVAGRRVTPEFVSAAILKRLKLDAERQVGPIGPVVITVPAYFDHARREATIEAGRRAGLDVVAILNEPTAAALAYGHRQGFLAVRADRTPDRGAATTVLVYDLGGGTFDVNVMRIRGREFKTLVTDGDVRLGGRDWDRRIVDHAAEAYLADHPGDDPRDDPETLQSLDQAAESAKRALGEFPRTRLVYAHRSGRVSLELTSAQFEEWTADLLDRTRATTRLVLADAGLEWDEVDRVLCSGGSTRMPQVVRMLRELTGKEPDRSLSPDEAVAHGAALYHGILRAESGASNASGKATVVDVNSHSLGVVALAGQPRTPHNTILIPKNTPLPHAGARLYRTARDGQRRVLVEIVEGEAVDPKACISLGEFALDPLPPGLPRGTPIRIRYAYAADGRIRVGAAIEKAGLETEVQVTVTGKAVRCDVDEWAMSFLNPAEGGH